MFYGISNENWEGNCEEYELESHGVSCSYNIGSRLVDVDSPSYSSLEVDFPRDSGAVLIPFGQFYNDKDILRNRQRNREGYCEEYELKSHGASCSYTIGSRVVDVDSSRRLDFPRDSGGALNKNIAFSRPYNDKDILRNQQRESGGILRGI